MLTDTQDATPAVVFLCDVDNTLLDNDRFRDDLGDELERLFGTAARDRYWTIYDQRREELGYADYLGTLECFRTGLDNDPQLLSMSGWLLDYPFADRLYPQALETVAHLQSLGPTALLSDGDIVFQPRKIHRSGLWQALGGHVMVYLHKERMLVAMQQRYPAAHYVMVDDKPHLLARMKQHMGSRLTTVFVRQGHYAENAAGDTIDPAPDITIACIGDLRGRKLGSFLPTGAVISLPSTSLPSG
ncbi:HAD family hydrolase [Rhodanobacter ginsenosidimutans]|uniref:HAD family hydrolase n=1 Tax=Rhodanobacter ginsenosidimutans TaxID=490571 RepID=A0ABW0K1P7_9GAMM